MHCSRQNLRWRINGLCKLPSCGHSAFLAIVSGNPTILVVGGPGLLLLKNCGLHYSHSAPPPPVTMICFLYATEVAPERCLFIVGSATQHFCCQENLLFLPPAIIMSFGTTAGSTLLPLDAFTYRVKSLNPNTTEDISSWSSSRLDFISSMSFFIALHWLHFTFLKSYTSISCCGTSLLFITMLQPSLEHSTGEKLHSATWGLRSSKSNTCVQPRSVNSQQILREDNDFDKNREGFRRVSTVNSSRQDGQVSQFSRCLVMHGLQKWCSFLWHCIGSFKTLRQIEQWKSSSTAFGKRLSSYPTSSDSIIVGLKRQIIKSMTKRGFEWEGTQSKTNEPVNTVLLLPPPFWEEPGYEVLSIPNMADINLVSLWRRANARNIRLYYPYWQYTDLFIFRFVSLLCLRSTLHLLI